MWSVTWRENDEYDIADSQRRRHGRHVVAQLAGLAPGARQQRQTLGTSIPGILTFAMAGALTQSQERIPDRFNILMRGIFRVGTDALVDEATVCQAIRA